VQDGIGSRSEAERQLIAFSLHGEHYGLPIASVQEIIRYTPPRLTATARGLIQGMVSLRGRVLPVVDLSGRLGKTLEVTDATRILVVEVSTGILGLIVDRVEGVMQIPTHRIEDIPSAVASDAVGHQIAAMDDRLVMLIDSERALAGLLPGAPAQEPDPARSEPARHEPPASRAPRARRAQGAPGTPPARRRSAAAPQAPRSRGRPRRGRDGEG
jgi:purine-binding chemotaxis protein CheW